MSRLSLFNYFESYHERLSINRHSKMLQLSFTPTNFFQLNLETVNNRKFILIRNASKRDETSLRWRFDAGLPADFPPRHVLYFTLTTPRVIICH